MSTMYRCRCRPARMWSPGSYCSYCNTTVRADAVSTYFAGGSGPGILKPAGILHIQPQEGTIMNQPVTPTLTIYPAIDGGYIVTGNRPDADNKWAPSSSGVMLPIPLYAGSLTDCLVFMEKQLNDALAA